MAFKQNCYRKSTTAILRPIINYIISMLMRNAYLGWVSNYYWNNDPGKLIWFLIINEVMHLKKMINTV